MKKIDITQEQADRWIANGGETNFWMIAPDDTESGHVSAKPTCPKDYKIFDADPHWKGPKFWHIGFADGSKPNRWFQCQYGVF